MRSQTKNLITLDSWSRGEIDRMLEVSSDLKARRVRGEHDPLLEYKTLFMIFFEQSTRTRNSLEAAMTQLGGHAHDLTADKLQIAHGESPKDTAKVLSGIGEGIAIRNCVHGTGNRYIGEIARHASIPVVSMQDDIYHPLQAAADLMTIKETCGENLRGLKVAVLWAYATSHAKPLSVPQSQILLFPRYGIDVALAHPPEFPLEDDIVARARGHATESGAGLTIVNDMAEAVRDADVVIPKNWGGFGFFDQYTGSEEQRSQMKANLERNKGWICDADLFSHAKPEARVMHALPADRGNEVTDEVLDSPNSVIYQEAENRLHTAKGILALTMGGLDW
jgi:ornithine carbamoyltransferase